jgi:hypothetical protein
MIVQQAKSLVRQWVETEASATPGFCGAFFHGSVNDLPDAADLPPTSDVDVLVVLDRPAPPQKLGKFHYQGVIIEASYLAAAEVASAEQVLGQAHLAGSLRSPACLIADPTGRLSAVQAGVGRDFTRREWVLRRCRQAEDRARRNFDALNEAAPFHDQVTAWLFGTGVITHILLVAGLQNPTVRKRYLAVRALLAQYDLSALYPALLESLGCASLSRADAARHLPALEAAFDAAAAVIRSPYPFAADLSALARPVAIDGSRELIEQGDHREALFWMAVTFSRCQKVLFEDGPAELFAQHDIAYRALLADLGIRSFADLHARRTQALEQLPAVWAAAEALIAANPAVLK